MKKLLKTLLPSIPAAAVALSAAHAESDDLPTYYGKVAEILQNRCVECHREGASGPFPLDTFEAVTKRQRVIQKVLDQELMPPWFAKGGHWQNDRSLTQPEKETLLRWLDSELPAGDAADAPEPREFPEVWHIGGGKPDAIVQFENPVTVPAEGSLPYEYVRVKTSFPEDRWVREIEIVPGEKQVVHHVSVMFEGAAGPGGFGIFGVYVPGSSHVSYPEGMAKKLPAGTTLVFEMHYTPAGREVQDTTRLGMVFSKDEPKHEVLSGAVADIRLRIPPGAADHEEEGKFKLQSDAKLLSIMPHMHWRGKAFEMIATTPDDKEVELLSIPRYDFDWQLTYRFAEPPTFPAGTWLSVKGIFDNSEDNPENPDPTKTVRWGQQTEDEMLVGYFEYYVP